MPDAQNGALLLAAALVAGLAGMGWLALAMEVHWAQALGRTAHTPARARLLRVLGTVALACSLVLCLSVDHASMATLVWVMLVAGAAMAVAFTLSWRAAWLRVLVPWWRAARLDGRHAQGG